MTGRGPGAPYLAGARVGPDESEGDHAAGLCTEQPLDLPADEMSAGGVQELPGMMDLGTELAQLSSSGVGESSDAQALLKSGIKKQVSRLHRSSAVSEIIAKKRGEEFDPLPPAEPVRCFGGDRALCPPPCFVSPYMIPAQSNFRACWDLLLIALMMYIAVILPGERVVHYPPQCRSFSHLLSFISFHSLP